MLKDRARNLVKHANKTLSCRPTTCMPFLEFGSQPCNPCLQAAHLEVSLIPVLAESRHGGAAAAMLDSLRTGGQQLPCRTARHMSCVRLQLMVCWCKQFVQQLPCRHHIMSAHLLLCTAAEVLAKGHQLRPLPRLGSRHQHPAAEHLQGGLILRSLTLSTTTAAAVAA